MLGEDRLERFDVRSLAGEGRTDDFRPMHAEELHEIEIARIVDDDAIARREEEPGCEIERLRGRIGQHDLGRIDPRAAIGESSRDEPAQGFEAARRVVMQLRSASAAGDRADRPLDAGRRQPAFGQPS